jgi:hypothetical protein
MTTTPQHSARSTQDILRDFLRAYWREFLAALVVLITRLLTAPRTLWEADEHLFVAAVKSFEPLANHPHPPGYPLYVGLGKFAAAFTDNLFGALVVVSIVACVVGVVALSLAFRRIVGDADADLAVSGALLYYFGAAMLVHGTLAMSDSAAIACTALALLAMTYFPDDATERTAIGLGIAASAAIGIRPQLVVPLLPVFLLVLLLMTPQVSFLTTRPAIKGLVAEALPTYAAGRAGLWSRDVRKIVAGLAAFAFVSIAWFAQLVEACKGWEKFVAWETHQASYVAQHDAAASRGAHSMGEVASRFIFHPWGPKSIALPVLLLALLGIIVFFRTLPAAGRRRSLPILLFAAIHLVFAVTVMDPADAPRYALPWLIAVALFAGLGLGIVRDSLRFKPAPYAAVALLAILSWVYVAPIIVTRHRQPSSGAAAAAYANATYPPNTVVLYDLSLRPQAEVLFARFPAMALDRGLAAFYDRPDVPLVAFGDGGAFDANAKTFAWPDSDAYGKLTRDHYRVISLDPVDPRQRFLPLRGVYVTERTDVLQWRWLQPNATIRLPRAHGSTLLLTFGLAHDVPYETNDVRVSVNGTAGPSVTVTRTAPATLTVGLPSAPVVDVTITAARSFAPASVLHNQDPRVLAVQLLRAETQ